MNNAIWTISAKDLELLLKHTRLSVRYSILRCSDEFRELYGKFLKLENCSPDELCEERNGYERLYNKLGEQLERVQASEEVE